MRVFNQKTPVNVVITSVLLALFVDTQILNLIILAASPSFSGVMAVMYGVEVVCLLFMGVLFQRRSILSLNPFHIGIFILCSLWYMITVAFVGNPSVSISFFCIFTLSAFIIPSVIRIDLRTFLLALMLLPSIGVFYIRQIIFDSIMNEGLLSMGKCYSMLMPVLANLVFLRFFYMKEKNWLRIILLPFTAINIFYLLQMTMYGSRGPILCVLMLIASFFIVEINDDNQFHIRKGRAVMIALGAIFIVVLFIPILQFIHNFFADYDIQINVVEKFIRLDGSGDMSNGRKSILELALQGFWSSPLIGNGLAQFEHNTGVVYPHNFILQMLYDGGLVLTCFVLGPIFKVAYNKFKYIDSKEFICLLFLLLASVPAASFSGDLWNAGTLWLFFGFVLSKNTVVN